MNPLVSIIVITYNSEKYIEEALESVKNQDHIKIELIVSDDCSSDRTVNICSRWIALNNKRFVRTELLTVSENTGTTRNLNRAFKMANGSWIKSIAGDDALHKNCIRRNLDFIKNNPDSRVIISKYEIYNGIFTKSNLAGIRPTEDMYHFFELESNEQLESMRFKGEHLILGMFVNAEALRRAGGCDERFRLLEDLPLLLKFLEADFKFYFLPEVTTLYRRNINTISNQTSRGYKLLLKEMIRAYRWYRRPHLKLFKKLHNDIYFLNELILVYCFKGRRNKVFRIIKKSLTQLSPMHHKMRKEIRRA